MNRTYGLNYSSSALNHVKISHMLLKCVVKELVYVAILIAPKLLLSILHGMFRMEFYIIGIWSLTGNI